MSSKISFLLSFLLSSMVYGGLFIASPHIAVLGKSHFANEVTEAFRVSLREEDDTVTALQQEIRTESLTSRPESIEDLLDWDKNDMADLQDTFREVAEIPQLGDRLASEKLQREHDLAPEEKNLATMDERIIEISAAVARADVEIVRRFVRPSPTRVLDKDATPVLRGPNGRDGSDVLNIGRVIDTETVQARREEKRMLDIEMLNVFEERRHRRSTEEGLPLLPIELEMARRPIVEAIQKSSTVELIDDLMRIDISTYTPPEERYGYFKVHIAPGPQAEMDILPKNVTFVVDASKSILQAKLNLMVRGINKIVNDLRPGDNFNIVIFRELPRRLSETFIPATAENKRAAYDFLDGLEAYGETDVYEGIRPVIQQKGPGAGPDIIVLTSDGRPTMGVRDARDIINALTEENKQGISILAYGSGRTANRYLLDLLAYRNKGESFITRHLDDIDEELPAFFDRVTDPVLVDLHADYGQVDKAEVFPRELPDFFKKKAITLYGRYDPKSQEEFVMRLVGRAGREKKELVFKANLKEGATGDNQIARGWAFQKTYHIIGEICRVGETPELLNELRALGRKYDIKTSYD